MRIRRVPEHLKIKVIKWFDYLWMTKKSSDEFQCVSFLPGKMFFQLFLKSPTDHNGDRLRKESSIV